MACSIATSAGRAGSPTPRFGSGGYDTRSCVLFVFAHPDDESFGPAGTLGRYHAIGVRTGLLIVTHGEAGQLAGVERPDPLELGTRRVAELRHAADLLAIDDLVVMEYPDGRVADAPFSELVADVRETVRRLGAQVVVTFGPEGITRHPDHTALGRATEVAFFELLGQGGPCRKLYYDCPGPDHVAQLGLVGPEARPTTMIEIREYAALKVAALEAHSSQPDARDMANELRTRPPTAEYFHRAHPTPPDEIERDLFEGVDERG